jgi:hypothetical protein
MQAKELIGLMNGTIAYTEDTLLNLRNLLEDYPYFQIAQLLYTFHLQEAKDSRFNAELRKAACYAGDRRSLFYRVRSDAFPPGWIEAMEKKEEPAAATSFDRIDSFLAEQDEKEPEPPTDTPQLLSTDYLSYTLSETADAAGSIPLQHQDTIDRFLEENERSPVKIILKDRDAETATEMLFPDLDTVEEGSFFSETLAKIYLKQKKYEKALVIIRQLYLLYPEKNRYFADQIRFLEKLVHNIKKTK